MENTDKTYKAHVLAVPYPSQGHINPMLQFSKRLASKGLKATLATTVFISKSIKCNSSSDGSVQFDWISDGFDESGFLQAGSVEAYHERLEAVGSKTLAELIIKHKASPHPIDCIIYDPFLPWVLDVAKQLGLVGAAFFTQACGVNCIYYNVHHGLLPLPITSKQVSVSGLPLLELKDTPSYIYVPGSYPGYFEMVLTQFSNIDKADFVLYNSFYELEKEVVDSLSKSFRPLLTIGPTLPSVYLDNRLEGDNDYGLNLFTSEYSSIVTSWLDTKPKDSVVYVSFGSMADLSEKQTEEVAWGLKESNHYFLWVVRAQEEAKLPKDFEKDITNKGLIVKWSPQLKVLSHEATGCFVTHCGWNSTIEALSLGVPMVAMPQWTDQPTNAKFVEDVWKLGIRVKVDEENGIVRREEIERCVKELMEGEKGKEMKIHAKKWRELAIEAVCEGGTSDRNIEEFVSKLTG